MTSPHLSIKTVFISLFICVTMIAGNAAGEEHISIQATYSDSSVGRVASADFYEQNQQTIAVSTLFPELAVNLREQNHILFRIFPHALSLMHPEKFEAMIMQIDTVVSEWMNENPGTVSEGVYAGETFQHADNVCKNESSMDELLEYIYSKIKDTNKTDMLSYEAGEICMLCCEMLKEASAGLNLKVCISKYNEGQYYTVSINENEKIIYTVSVDKSEDKMIDAVLGWRTGGRYYYRSINCQYDKNSISIQSAFYSGKESSYRAVSKHTALFKESVSITEAEDQTVTVQGKLESWKLPIPVIISGNCHAEKEEYAELDFYVLPENTFEHQFHITACYEKQIRPVSFPDKKITDIRNEKDREHFSKDCYSGFSDLVTAIIPRLPIDYQKILIDLLIN